MMDQRRERERARQRRPGVPSARTQTTPTPAPVASPEPSPVDRVLSLQGAAGNATVARILAPSTPESASMAGVGADGPAAMIADGGSSLDAGLRGEMEGAYGADLSTVRVHDGPDAAASASALGARAYTVGDDIVVGEGGADRRTMAHELAHVVQQRAGAVDGTLTAGGYAVSDPDDRFERDASAAADAIAAGSQGVAPAGIGSTATGPMAAQRALLGDEAPVAQRLFEDEEEEAKPEVSAGGAQESIPTVNVEDLPSAVPTVNVEDLPKANQGSAAEASVAAGGAGGSAKGAGGSPAPATNTATEVPAKAVGPAASGAAGSPTPAATAELQAAGQPSAASPTQAASAVRDSLVKVIDGMSANPPDYKGAYAALIATKGQSDALFGAVKSDPGAVVTADEIDKALWIVAGDLGPKAGNGPMMNDVKDAVVLEQARAKADALAKKLGGGG